MSSFESIKERSKNLLVYGGITAVTGAAMLGIGGSVLAQDESTPAAGTEETSGATDASTAQPTYEAEYAAFLDALADNLGVADGATVDAAIRTTMKQMIDERLAAGEISADLATELKAAIDSGELPVGLVFPGVGGFGGPRIGGERDFGGPGGRVWRDRDHHRPSHGHDAIEDADKPVDAIDDTAEDDTLIPATGSPTADSGPTA